MKGAADRTKVVLRHLPPTISQAMLMEQIDGSFAGRYNFVSFRPDINRVFPEEARQKHQTYSRAYINFQRPEDVIEFADFFGGHVFVNEKGTQFKTIVEYAPSQRVPKHFPKKDGREGTINKDPEYLEFLESIAKPVENLPSAEIQLERREAERAGAVKDAPIVTPLMQFVRQKRAAKGGSRRSLGNGKPTRTGGIPSGSSSSVAIKRGSERRKVSNTMYVLKDSAKSTSGKDKSTHIMVLKQNEHKVSQRSVSVGASGTEVVGEESGVPGNIEIGKKKILLLKAREKEVPRVYGDLSLKQTATSPIKNSVRVTALRQNHQPEASGKIIKGILNKDSRQSLSMLQPDKRNQVSYQDKDKRVPRQLNTQSFLLDTNGENTIPTEKLEKRTMINGRPDRGVWTALRRSDGSHASNESLQSASSQIMQSSLDRTEGAQGDPKKVQLSSWGGELKHTGGGRHMSVDNGSYKHGGRRGPPRNGKDTDGSLIIGEGKSSKRGASSGYGSHEKQVWVQKSSSGS